MERVKGKVAIVTGGGSGLGRATSVLLADEGAKVVVTDINEEGALATVEQIKKAGGDAECIRHDVSDEKGWKAVIDKTLDRYERLDILDNNAGICVFKPLLATSLDEFRHQNAINVEGVFLGMKFAVPAMEKSGGGSIINISSVAGLVGGALNGGYRGSKGAIRLLSKSMALECASRKNNVRVNSIHPGSMPTGMVDKIIRDMGGSEELRQKFDSMAPLGHSGEPLDIANGVLYLASDESKYVTGSELVIDGGFVAQ
jgi:NAD(P)-dependent dehydrogenase (short-subunit alcohol dehydrogenase family)